MKNKNVVHGQYRGKWHCSVQKKTTILYAGPYISSTIYIHAVETKLHILAYFLLIKHNDQKQTVDERFIWFRLPNHSSSLRKLRTEIPAQEEVGRMEEGLQPFCVYSANSHILKRAESARVLLTTIVLYLNH